MGVIWGTVLSVLGVTAAILIPVIARVVSDDIKEWLPWITQRLIERAVSRLPEKERDRFEEEWWAHINELPGNLAKVYAAWGCLSAAKGINHIAISGETSRIEEVTRRVIEVTISVTLLSCVLPLMLAISTFIKLDSRGPVLLKQKRLGADNIPFYLLRFRSMYVETPGSQIAKAGYPRLTRVGRVLRMMGLDELPQLINVLRGEMSLVGPPAVPFPSGAGASAKSEAPVLRRLCRLKPGIFAWTKINKSKGKAKTIDDLYYLENRSLRLDLVIIVRTVLAVLFRGSVAPAPAPIDPASIAVACLIVITGMLVFAFLIIPAVIR